MIYHLLDQIKYQAPVVSSEEGAPQLAKTRISTSVKKCSEVCHIGRFSGGASKFICSSFFTFSLFPINNRHNGANDHGKSHRPDGPCHPHLKTQNAGGQNDGQNINGRSGIKESYGGTQSGTPLVDTREKRRMVQEQTAKMVPDTEATV